MHPGSEGIHTAVVTTQDTATALGSGTVPVLGTPRLVAWIEAAAIAALRDAVPDGSTTVGVRVDIEHLAATPVGETVAAHATLDDVAGRRLTFSVSAHAGGTLVARGRHVRVVVEREQFLARLS